MPGFISWGSSGLSPKKHHDGDELFCGSPAVFSSTLRQAARVVSATWFASDCFARQLEDPVPLPKVYLQDQSRRHDGAAASSG